MSNSRRGALIGAVSGLALLGMAAGVHAETLADAISLAYDSNPTLQSQRASLRALDETWFQARAGYRPTLSVTARGTYVETRIPTKGITETNTGVGLLSLNQPVYTGGRVASALSAAEADVLSGRESLRRTEAQVLAQVIQSYVDVRRDGEAYRIRQTNVDVLQHQLDESRARFEVGEITRTDVAQSEARYAAAVSLLNSAQATLEGSRAAYRAVVGQNPGDLEPEPSLQSLLPASVDQAYDLADQNNGQVRAAEYTEQASRARIAAARAEQMPSLSLQGQVGYTGTASPMNTDKYYRSINGVAVLTVPLFSGGQTISRVRAAVERNNADRMNVDIAKRSVRQSLSQAWSSLLAARSNIDATAQQVLAARIAAEGVHQEQRVGLRTTIDVLNAEQELRSAELAQVSANRDAYVATSTVLAQTGRLQAEYLTTISTRYDSSIHFKNLRTARGWVPWEEPVAIVDGMLDRGPKTLPMAPPPAGLAIPASPKK